MKKLFLSAILPLFFILHIFSYSTVPKGQAEPFFALSHATAVAESTPAAGDYACILSDAAFFYTAAEDSRGLFLLPKTYYVKLLEYRPDFCKIEYQRDDGAARRLIGYAKTQDLTFVEYIPARPYLYYTFELRYKIENSNPADSAFLTELIIPCVYYGDYRVGSETYCYVLRGEEFGYVPKPSDVSYEENSEYADYLAARNPSAAPQEQEPSPAEGNTPAQIAILIAICLLVPVLAALVLKPPRRPPYEQEL